jgi:hypothetical protein
MVNSVPRRSAPGIIRFMLRVSGTTYLGLPSCVHCPTYVSSFVSLALNECHYDLRFNEP